MKSIILMLTFLTRLPIKYSFDFKREDFIRGIVFVPVIGLIIGLMLWIISLTHHYLHKPIVVLMVWTTYIFITGGLHIDGLSDTIDGIFSNRTKDRVLEIMKDSRVGTFGVLGILIILGYNVLLCLYIDYKYLIIIPVIGRCCALIACSISNYARNEGLGKDFIENCHKREGIIATFLMILIGILISGLKVIILLLFLILITLQLTKYIKSKIGGMTGDTIGFIIETTQTIGILGIYIMERVI